MHLLKKKVIYMEHFLSGGILPAILIYIEATADEYYHNIYKYKYIYIYILRKQKVHEYGSLPIIINMMLYNIYFQDTFP